MNNWQEFDDYMIFNEDEKRVITWTTYGNTKKYFLSTEYYYEDDMFEESGDTWTLVNEEIENDGDIELLIAKTKGMV